MSNEKKPGWLGYIGDYTTQLYRDYKKEAFWCVLSKMFFFVLVCISVEHIQPLQLHRQK